MMKTLISLLAVLTFLSACSLRGEFPPVESATPSAAILAATSTHTPVLPDTPIPPTAVPPTTVPPTTVPASPTPVSPQIGIDTVARLSNFSTFGEGESLRSLAFSPDGTVLVSAGGNSEDFSIRIWEVASGLLLRTLEGHTSIVWTVAFSPDGQILASASSDGTVKIWDWHTGSVLKSLDFPNQVVSVTFSPDGQILAAGGVEEWPNAAIWTFSVASWQPLMKLTEFWNIPAIVFSPDSQYIVGGGTSRNVRVWKTNDGTELFTLNHPGQVSNLAISPDGSTIATGLCEVSGENDQCTHGGVWFWDLFTGKLISKLGDLPGWVEKVAFSIDGSLLITGSRDGTVGFYASSDFNPIFVTSSPGGGGVLAVSPDGRFLATSGSSGLIHLWRVSP